MVRTAVGVAVRDGVRVSVGVEVTASAGPIAMPVGALRSVFVPLMV